MMRHAIKYVFLYSVMVLFAMTTRANAPATNNQYKLDPLHSYVLWNINHFGFSNPSGKWFTNGTIVFDQQHPEQSQVNATIQLATIVTGIPALDKHLESPAFFDVAKYPTATFVSDKIVVTGKQAADITGTLTLHGVSKPVTLHATLNKEGVNPINNLASLGFSATATLNRSEFGINTLLPNLSDKVELRLEIEANKPNPA